MSVVRWVSDNSSRRFGVLGRAVAQNILLYLDRGLGKELSGKWTPIDTEKSLWSSGRAKKPTIPIPAMGFLILAKEVKGVGFDAFLA